MFEVVFYETVSGNEVVLDFLRALPRDDRKRIGENLMTVQIGFPLGLPLCRPLKGGLLEMRSSLPSRREARLFFMFDREGQRLVVLHGFLKTSQTTPKAELELARKRIAEFRTGVTK